MLWESDFWLIENDGVSVDNDALDVGDVTVNVGNDIANVDNDKDSIKCDDGDDLFITAKEDVLTRVDDIFVELLEVNSDGTDVTGKLETLVLKEIT